MSYADTMTALEAKRKELLALHDDFATCRRASSRSRSKTTCCKDGMGRCGSPNSSATSATSS